MIQSGDSVSTDIINAMKTNSDWDCKDWSIMCSKNGSQTLKTFPSTIRHIIKNLPDGYGKGKKAMILEFDGHASRWSYSGLMLLMANNVWPFCLASHTSSWSQACDCGVNLRIRTLLGYECEEWRHHNFRIHFTRINFVECFARAMKKFKQKLKNEISNNPLPQRLTVDEFNERKQPSPTTTTSSSSSSSLSSVLSSSVSSLSVTEQIAQLAISIDDLLEVKNGKETEDIKRLEEIITNMNDDFYKDIDPKIVEKLSRGKKSNQHAEIQRIAQNKIQEKYKSRENKLGNIITRAFDFVGSVCFVSTEDGFTINPLCTGWSVAINTIGRYAAPDKELFNHIQKGSRLSARNVKSPVDTEVTQVVMYRNCDNKSAILRAFVQDALFHKFTKVLENTRNYYETRLEKNKQKRRFTGISTNEGADMCVGNLWKRTKEMGIKARKKEIAMKEGQNKREMAKKKKIIKENDLLKQAQAILNNEALTKEQKKKELTISRGLLQLMKNKNMSVEDNTGKRCHANILKDRFWSSTIGQEVSDLAGNSPVPVNPLVLNIAAPAAVQIAVNDNEANGELEESDDLDNSAQNSPEEEDSDLMEIEFDDITIEYKKRKRDETGENDYNETSKRTHYMCDDP